MVRAVIVGFAGLILLSGVAAAQCTRYPTTLTNENMADANWMMGDFNDLAGCVAPLANSHVAGKA
jgi:hypothetical protein